MLLIMTSTFTEIMHTFYTIFAHQTIGKNSCARQNKRKQRAGKYCLHNSRHCLTYLFKLSSQNRCMYIVYSISTYVYNVGFQPSFNFIGLDIESSVDGVLLIVDGFDAGFFSFPIREACNTSLELLSGETRSGDCPEQLNI